MCESPRPNGRGHNEKNLRKNLIMERRKDTNLSEHQRQHFSIGLPNTPPVAGDVDVRHLVAAGVAQRLGHRVADFVSVLSERIVFATNPISLRSCRKNPIVFFAHLG